MALAFIRTRPACTIALSVTVLLLTSVLLAPRADARQGTFRLSISYQGTPTNVNSRTPSLSKDGTQVAFVTSPNSGNIFPPNQSYGNIVVRDVPSSEYWQPRPVPRLFVSDPSGNKVHVWNVLSSASLEEIAQITVGSSPGFIEAMSPTSPSYTAASYKAAFTPQVFVASEGSGKLSVLSMWGMYSDPANDVVLGAPGVSVPSSITKDLVRERLYVTDSNQNRVFVVNPKTSSATGMISVGMGPAASALCVPTTTCGTTKAARRLFVANRLGGTLSVIDPELDASVAVSATIPVGNEPTALELTSRRLYVANFGDDTVSVLTPSANTPTYTIAVGDGPRDLAVMGSRVFVANYNSSDITVISDVATAPTVVATVTVPGNPVDVEAGDKELFVISESGAGGMLTVIDERTLVPTLNLPLSFLPGRARFTWQPGTLQPGFAGSQPSLSRTGRYLVFTTAKPSELKPVSSSVPTVYLYDRLTRSLEPVAVTDLSEPFLLGDTSGNLWPVVSDDGRYVALVSKDSRFLPETEDTNLVEDVFLIDRQKTRFRAERVSVSTVNEQANGASNGKIAISGDGRYIAFSSVATNLVPNDLNAKRDVFVRDRDPLGGSPDTKRASISSTQVEGNGDSAWPSISDDGRYVAFESVATNLVASDTNGQSDVFVRDFLLAVTDRASVSSVLGQAKGASNRPSMAADGRAVAFSSTANDLVPFDWNAKRDIFVRDRIERRTYIASRTTFGGVAENGDSDNPSLAGDGLTVAFDSLANNLVTNPDDSNGLSDVFLRRIYSMPERVSADTLGVQGSTDANRAAVSRDGRFVAFHTRHAFDPNDTNNDGDVYVRDRYNDSLERVSISNTGAEPNGGSRFAAMSGDGRYVAFVSSATNLITETVDDNGQTDIYIRDRLAGRTYLVSQNNAGEIARGGPSRFPAISDSGRFVAFQSAANNLVPGDTNNQWDIFLRDLVLGTTIRISVKSDGSECKQGPFPASTRPAISTGGGFVVFHSWCKDLVDSSSPGGADTNNVADVYLRDWMNSITERVSLTNTGGQADGPSQFPTISSNGRYIAFHSTATNLVGGDTNGKRDVFVRDRVQGKTHRVSVNSAGQQASKDSGYASIAPNDTKGYLVVFHSEAADLVAPGIDTNNVRDCYARWVPSSTTYGVAATWRIAIQRPGLESSDSLQFNNWSGTCVASRDASPFVFQTAATNVVGEVDQNGSVIDIYAAEL